MITMNEILQGRAQLTDLPPHIQKNLKTLLQEINIIRTAYGKPMKVNDGYRRPSDTPKNGAAKSKHLEGLAIDLDDDDKGTLWFWLMQNLKLVQTCGLYLEHGCWTHNKLGSWVHFQIVPPASGKRIFIPSNSPNPNPTFWNGQYDSKYDGTK